MLHREAIVPLLLFIAGAAALAGILLLLAKIVLRGRPNPVKQMPYESGVDPIHDTRRPFDVRFYLVAVAFLVFDVEVLFLYPWAAAAGGIGDGRTTVVGSEVAATAAAGPAATSTATTEMISSGSSSAPSLSSEYTSKASPLDAAVRAGWVPDRLVVFWGVAVFFALLLLGLAYDWRKGVFRWR